MSTLDKTLKGSDFCHMECSEQNATIHPETCARQVLIGDNSSTTLVDWINHHTIPEGTDPFISFDNTTGLLDWLNKNYSLGSLNPATTTTLGGVRIDTTYLTIDDGLLGLDKSSLNIPSSIEPATFTSFGTVMLGNNTKLPNTFANSTITDGSVTLYPLRIDNNNRAGIAIPNSTFAQEQADWNTTNTESASYIKNKPQVFNTTTNGLVPSPSSTSGKFLKDDGTWDTPASTAYTAGKNIDITNNVISATDTTYSTATDETLGLIKIGFNSTENRKAVQLDNNNNAYVELKIPTAAWVGNGLSQHYFSITQTGYIPIMKIKLHSGYNDGFKTNVRFQIIGRHNGHYFGDFYLNYKSDKGCTAKIVDINVVSDNYPSSNDKCLLATDIVVKLNYNLTHAVIYRKIRNYYDYPDRKDVFIVSIVGNNDQADNSYLNDMTYYCTTIFNSNGNEVLVGDTTTDEDSAIITEELISDYTHIGMVPYSDPEVSGQVWNDNGILKVSTGVK